MGQSSSAYSSQLSTQLNSAIFNSMLNIQNQNAQNCTSTQVQNFTNGPTGVIQCSINLSQVAQLVCNSMANFNTNASNNITTVINSAIQQMSTQAQTASQAFLTTALSMNVSNTQLVSHIQNLISTNLNTSIINMCLQNAAVIQNGTFLNNGTITCSPTTAGPGAITINQNAQLQAIASCITNNVFTLLASDTLLASIATAASQTQTTTQAGIFSFLSLTTLFIVLAVLALLALGYYIYKKQSPQGQAATAATTIAQGLLVPHPGYPAQQYYPQQYQGQQQITQQYYPQQQTPHQYYIPPYQGQQFAQQYYPQPYQGQQFAQQYYPQPYVAPSQYPRQVNLQPNTAIPRVAVSQSPVETNISSANVSPKPAIVNVESAASNILSPPSASSLSIPLNLQPIAAPTVMGRSFRRLY
ncbi:MAG: hypothetical protein Sylvanvirus1_8 [Sylvanvirus sp.]|uniref:Uncharacterized protein n=1 Tax=Sylvanvirus sp. TaxID=2487774 RepID=A0A3G5AGV0_9VIRU|nr:MAG: hypothetical protein Sylvanvirus1_8 [Sylvanvirus sp.]